MTVQRTIPKAPVPLKVWNKLYPDEMSTLFANLDDFIRQILPDYDWDLYTPSEFTYNYILSRHDTRICLSPIYMHELKDLAQIEEMKKDIKLKHFAIRHKYLDLLKVENALHAIPENVLLDNIHITKSGTIQDDGSNTNSNNSQYAKVGSTNVSDSKATFDYGAAVDSNTKTDYVTNTDNITSSSTGHSATSMDNTRVYQENTHGINNNNYYKNAKDAAAFITDERFHLFENWINELLPTFLYSIYA